MSLEQKNNNNKTILYVGGFELPDKNAAAQRVISNAKIFRELGYNVVFIGVSKAIEKKVFLEDTIDHFEGFQYYSIPYPKSILDWLSYLSKVSYLNLMVKINPSIVIAYNYPSLVLNKLRKYCKSNQIKIIADVTEWYDPKGNFFYKILKKTDIYYRMEFVNNRLDGIIVISRYLYNYYKKTYLRNIIEIPPLVDLSMEKWAPLSFSEEHDYLKLIYAGSPGKKNKDRLDYIILFINNFLKEQKKKVKLTIVGITEKQFIEYFNPSEQVLLEMNSWVNFWGQLSHPKTLELIKENDFQIFIRENNLVNNAGFPTKFVEAISCGIPVITNISGNLNDYLYNGFNGCVVEIDSDESFYDSLKNALFHDRKTIEQMKVNCKTMKIFDYHFYISPMEDFLKAI